jgi:hypothetical protein
MDGMLDGREVGIHLAHRRIPEGPYSIDAGFPRFKAEGRGSKLYRRPSE